jgi:hypothetical protein
MAKVDIPPLQGTTDATEQYFEITDKIPAEIWYWAAISSILASAGLFLVNKRDWSNFVGQWPPTFLLLGLFHKVLRRLG